MLLPTQRQLQEKIDEEEKKIDRLKRARDQFLVEWEKIEKEQVGIVETLSVYMEKIKMRDVLKTIHSIKE